MKIEIVGSTNGLKTKEEILQFSRAAARVCYSQHDFQTLTQEPDKKDLIGMTLKSGHHSPYDHVHLTLYLEDLPKFGAMILNDERPYTSSEKSARYTKMKVTGRQKDLYDHWLRTLIPVIAEKYPQLEAAKTEKLAQENARYMTSVFTPTKMLYTVSFRDLNHLMHYFRDFAAHQPESEFNNRVKNFMDQFNQQLRDLYIPELDPTTKKRKLRLFASRNQFAQEFGENYSISCQISFAGLAQSHRHRTLDYEMQPINPEQQPEFFVPAIIRDQPELANAWNQDLNTVFQSGDFPQGMLIDVHEFGSYLDFISKMNERLCGHAQWETMDRTRKTLEEYLRQTHDTNPEVHEQLNLYSGKPRCQVPGTRCHSPCDFGPGLALERLI